MNWNLCREQCVHWQTKHWQTNNRTLRWSFSDDSFSQSTQIFTKKKHYCSDLHRRKKPLQKYCYCCLDWESISNIQHNLGQADAILPNFFIFKFWQIGLTANDQIKSCQRGIYWWLWAHFPSVVFFLFKRWYFSKCTCIGCCFAIIGTVDIVNDCWSVWSVTIVVFTYTFLTLGDTIFIRISLLQIDLTQIHLCSLFHLSPDKISLSLREIML